MGREIHIFFLEGKYFSQELFWQTLYSYVLLCFNFCFCALVFAVFLCTRAGDLSDGVFICGRSVVQPFIRRTYHDLDHIDNVDHVDHVDRIDHIYHVNRIDHTYHIDNIIHVDPISVGLICRAGSVQYRSKPGNTC